MPYIRYNDKNIFYELKENLISEENKEALLFIHGSGGSSNIWKNQFDMNIDLDIISIDLPSHARSDEFSILSLELYVDVVKKLVDSLNYEGVILCGHSLGGAIGQSYYFKYPNDVKALILCGTGGRLRVSPLILDSLKNNFQEFLKSMPRGAFYRKTSKEIIDNYINETSKIKPEVSYQDFSICDKFDILNKLNSISVPCLIVCGTADNLTPPKYAKYSHDKIQNSELILIENAGHMAMVEKPDEINKAIQDFLKKLKDTN